MKIDQIKNPLSTLSGIGPAAAALFANLNVFTIGDLLQFYPRDYKDRTVQVPLSQFNTAKEINTLALVTGHQWFGYGKMRTLKIMIRDITGAAELIAFNRAFFEKSLPVNSIIAVSGTFSVKYGKLQSSSFEAEKIIENGDFEKLSQMKLPSSGIIPVYPLTEGLSQKKVSKAMQTAASQYLRGIDSEIPEKIAAQRQLISKMDAIKKIHFPESFEDITIARKTLAYEELFKFQCTIAKRALEHKGAIPEMQISGITEESVIPESTENVPDTSDFSPKQKELLKRIPFQLTKDQISVICQMNSDIDRGYQERSQLLKEAEKGTAESFHPPFTMQRLLQGDVGSGKTLTALFACLRVIDWGGQCALMAPTEILAKQHGETTAKLLEPLGIRTAFLTGNLKASGRNNLLKALKEGDIDILVGTHALFSKMTVYKDLQLAVIDEQHRFGVLQRQAIIEKGRNIIASKLYAAPHLLMMSATPIPQSLALTAFGDLDVSVIKTMPNGRKPITTYLVEEGHEMNAYNAVRKELQQNHQAYFVYPAIEDNPDSQSTSFKSAEKAFEELSTKVFPDYKCALIHSKIPEEEQSNILNDFRKGEIQILAATTVVEVGVDVPNATCMVIEQADCFGLAQLHQLRGRVGRGSSQSYCFLIFRKKITENGIQRMKILRQTTDGFVIAEEDLKLRGPGELTGTIQAGALALGIADLSKDRELLMLARADAFNYMRESL